MIFYQTMERGDFRSRWRSNQWYSDLFGPLPSTWASLIQHSVLANYNHDYQNNNKQTYKQAGKHSEARFEEA